MTDLPWLTILGIVPLVGALVVAALPNGRDALAKQVALLVSLVVLGLTIAMCAAFEPDGDRFQFVQAYDWIPAFGVQYAVGADGIALDDGEKPPDGDVRRIDHGLLRPAQRVDTRHRRRVGAGGRGQHAHLGPPGGAELLGDLQGALRERIELVCLCPHATDVSDDRRRAGPLVDNYAVIEVPSKMYGVVVVTGINPRRCRIGRLSGDASTWR